MKVYKLICHTTGKCYIGSTKNSLEWRLCHHKSPSNTCRSREIIEGGNYEIILLEEVEGTKYDLLEREKHYILTCDNVVNYLKLLNRTKEELRVQKREIDLKYNARLDIKEKKKIYRLQHKERDLNSRRKRYATSNVKRRANHIFTKDEVNRKKREVYLFSKTWGGDGQSHNNLLRIDVNLFQSATPSIP